VLDPGQASKINQLFGIVGERKRGDAEVDARLSAEGFNEPSPASAPAMTLEQMLGPNLKPAAAPPVDDMLLDAEMNFAKPQSPGRGPADGTLGTPQLIVDRLTGWLTGIGKAEALRRALRDWLKDDKTFDTDNRDDTFTQVTASVGPGIDFVVTGHTHLERAIDMGGGRFYFNCGTWIRLLQLTPAMLADEASFAGVYEVLTAHTMKAIDDKKFNGIPFVMDQSGAVSICERDGRAEGSLVHVEGDGRGEPRVIETFPKA
jgi:hypothetical protein